MKIGPKDIKLSSHDAREIAKVALDRIWQVFTGIGIADINVISKKLASGIQSSCAFDIDVECKMLWYVLVTMARLRGATFSKEVIAEEILAALDNEVNIFLKKKHGQISSLRGQNTCRIGNKVKLPSDIVDKVLNGTMNPCIGEKLFPYSGK